MSAARTTRWSRRSVAVGALALVAWQAATLLGALPRGGAVLGLFGFVWHVAFGKAYALVPSYFERQLAPGWAPAVQLPLTVTGATLLTAASAGAGPPLLWFLGGLAWAAGVAVFVGAIAWTVRDNPLGRETGTGGANTHRERLDRFANRFVPVAVAYLAVGSYEVLGVVSGGALPALAGRGLPGAVHLLAAGGAATLLLAVGFRLLPRFLVASPPRGLAALVLPAGAIGPALLAPSLGGGPTFLVGAVVEAVAIAGYAVAVAALYHRSDRRRVGFYGVLAGAASGVAGVALGLSFALDAVNPVLVLAHLRLNLLGFLGLTIVGLSYQFYPPTVGSFPGADDRTALATLAALAGGLWLDAAGVLTGLAPLVTVGRVGTLAGAVGYAALLLAVFRER